MTDQDRKDLERMYADLKKTLKPMSKNDLIRYVGALLVDNYVLKAEIDKRNSAMQAPEGQKEANNDTESNVSVSAGT